MWFENEFRCVLLYSLDVRNAIFATNSIMGVKCASFWHFRSDFVAVFPHRSYLYLFVPFHPTHTISSYSEVSKNNFFWFRYWLQNTKKNCVDFLYFKICIICVSVVFECANAIFKRFVHINDTHETCSMKFFNVNAKTLSWILQIETVQEIFVLSAFCTSKDLCWRHKNYSPIFWHYQEHNSSYRCWSNVKKRSLFHKKFNSSESGKQNDSLEHL